MSSERKESEQPTEFQRLGRRRSAGVLREYFDYVRLRKKWWLVPVIVLLLLVGLVLVLGSSAVGPLIYALF